MPNRHGLTGTCLYFFSLTDDIPAPQRACGTDIRIFSRHRSTRVGHVGAWIVSLRLEP